MNNLVKSLITKLMWVKLVWVYMISMMHVANISQLCNILVIQEASHRGCVLTWKIRLVHSSGRPQLFRKLGPLEKEKHYAYPIQICGCAANLISYPSRLCAKACSWWAPPNDLTGPWYVCLACISSLNMSFESYYLLLSNCGRQVWCCFQSVLYYKRPLFLRPCFQGVGTDWKFYTCIWIDWICV